MAPSLLPPGALIAVVSGNPAGPGESTIELSMPDGYRMPPHFHPSYERVEVKQGTLLVGVGDRIDPGKTLALSVGDTLTAPAGLHHYSIAKGQTVVPVRFVGPYTITYVHAHEAPRQGSFPLWLLGSNIGWTQDWRADNRRIRTGWRQRYFDPLETLA